MKTSFGIVALVSLLIAGVACASSGAATESPKVHTATPLADAVTATIVATDIQATSAPGDTAAPPTREPTETVEPTATALPETFLGDVIEHDGYSLAAVIVEDPATPGLFYQKQEGKRLVAVQVIAGNVSADPWTVNPLDVTLVDTEGFSYQSDLAAHDRQIQLVSLGKGERVKGWVAYQIPDAAVVKEIRYSVNQFSDIELRVGLAEPPAGHDPLLGTPREAPTLSKLGDAVEQGGYSITPMTFEDPAKPGIIYSPQKGTRLVAVELVLANVSGTKTSSNPLSFFLVDTDGFMYSAELGGRDGQLDLVDLSPGDKIKGWVSFQIPDDAVPESVQFAGGAFSDLAIVAGIGK